MAEPNPDPWHYPRRELAESYVRFYGPVQSLVLFSERRTGKTTFARKDLAPVAAQRGFQPVYVDLWTHSKDATTALVDGLRTAAQDLTRPNTRLGRVLNQPVTALSLPGLGSIELGGIPERGEPDDPLLRIRHWSDRIVERADRPVLLMVDEVQQIGVDQDGAATAAALRAALQRHDRNIAPFFTGSSADRLAAMFDDTGAAFYQHGARVTFPRMGREFSDFIADKHKASARGEDLDRDALWSAFEALDRRPGSLREMVNHMLTTAEKDIPKHLAIQRDREQENAERGLAVKELSPTHIGILARLAHDLPLFSEAARRYYGELNNAGDPANKSQVYRAVRTLQDKQIIHSGAGRADYRLTSQALGEVLRDKYPSVGADHDRAVGRGHGPENDLETDR